MEKGPIYQKSFDFAVRIIALSNYLQKEKHQFILANQILRSGTSIGANIREGKYAASSMDFVNKLTISLKEAEETEYWLELLNKAKIITNEQATSMLIDVQEIIKMLTSIIVTTKSNLKK